MGRLKNRYPEHQYLELRYEDLCHNPGRFLDQTMDFLCVDRQDMLSKTGAESHVLGNTMRMKFDGEIREDLTWKTTLQPEQIETVINRCRHFMRRYQYY